MFDFLSLFVGAHCVAVDRSFVRVVGGPDSMYHVMRSLEALTRHNLLGNLIKNKTVAGQLFGLAVLRDFDLSCFFLSQTTLCLGLFL